MPGVIVAELVALVAISYFVLEHGCAEHRERGVSWFDILAAKQLGVSKKSRTRGDVDRFGRTRRQRAHSH